MHKVHLERRPVDLAALVQRTLDTLRETGQLKDLVLEASIETAWAATSPADDIRCPHRC